MNFLLWNRLPNIGMGSKDLRSGFFFVFWNWNKATVCTRRHYRLYSLYFQWEIPCVEGISSPDSSCVWLETVFLTAAGSEDEPLLQGHMPGAVLHCGAILKQDSLVGQAQSYHDGLSFHEGHWAGSVKHFRAIISLHSVSALWSWRLPPCLNVSRLESFPFHPSVVLFLLSVQSRQGAQTGHHCSAMSLS